MMLFAGFQACPIDSLWWVKIERPTAVSDGIIEAPGFHQVLLSEDMLSNKTAALPFARQKTKPVECPVGSTGLLFFGRSRRAVFDVIPDSENNGQQFVADFFIILDGIQFTSPFSPPISVFM